MLLAIDIGNTNISFGIFSAEGGSACGGKDDKILKTFDIPSKQYSCNKMLKKTGSAKITDMLICSVVPKLTNVVIKDLIRVFGKRPYIIGKDMHVPIQNRYRNPNQVGQDRLVNAYAGARLYGVPLVVVDFGTAITFDVISKLGTYEGGLILPGIGISIDALNQRTALLPKINLKIPKEFIGKDTANSILSGLVYGFAAMTSQLNIELKKRLGKKTRIIATGGNARLMRKFCGNINQIDNQLTLKGINFIYKKNT